MALPALILAQPTTQPAYEIVGQIDHPPIRESSGIVASRKYPGVFWTLNDSGNPPAIYAVSREGKLVGEFPIRAQNVDWEDIAIDAGPDGAGRIYIADIGDNLLNRPTLQIHRIIEPDPKKTSELLLVETTWNLSYPAEPFDAEGLFILGDNGYIVSKHRDTTPESIYRFSLGATENPIKLEKIATTPIRIPATGADISQDGKDLAIITVGGPFVFHIDGDVSRAATVAPSHATLIDVDMEAVCFVENGLLATSESRSVTFFPTPLPEAIASAEKLSTTRPATQPATPIHAAVLQTNPADGAADIDPAIREIRVVFNQPMNPAGQSIVGGGTTFPVLSGATRWLDDRTLIIPVRVLPNRDYALSINSDRFTNFRTVAGEAVTPHPIRFHTGAARAAIIAPAPPRIEPPPELPSAPVAKPPAIEPENPAVSAIARLRKAIDNDYSYRDLRKVDWDKQFAERADKIKNAKSPADFARESALLLSAANDMHVHVRAGDQTFPTHTVQAEPNYHFRFLASTIPQWRDINQTVYLGRPGESVGYAMITTWQRDRLPSLEPIFALLRDPQIKSLIIDVRMNTGGDETLARELAGCFVNEPKVYAKNSIREAGAWRGPFDRTLEPNRAGPAFRGRVAVLMGNQCMSSNESFLLMMRAAGATLIGAKSLGASGNPKPHELGNGVTVFLSSWNDLLPDGKSFEGIGISPDVEVKTKPDDFRAADPVLDAAIGRLRSPLPPGEG